MKQKPVAMYNKTGKTWIRALVNPVMEITVKNSNDKITLWGGHTDDQCESIKSFMEANRSCAVDFETAVANRDKAWVTLQHTLKQIREDYEKGEYN